jgi:hypothetical protein
MRVQTTMQRVLAALERGLLDGIAELRHALVDD